MVIAIRQLCGCVGVDPEKAANARAAIDAQLPILAPEQDEAILRDSGFTNVSLFYVGFAFRGWVAYAAATQASNLMSASR